MKKNVHKNVHIRMTVFVALTLLALVPLSAKQPAADLLRTTDASRLAYEKSGITAVEAVVDDGFMNISELTQKKAEALATGDTAVKSAVAYNIFRTFKP